MPRGPTTRLQGNPSHNRPRTRRGCKRVATQIDGTSSIQGGTRVLLTYGASHYG